MDVILFAAVVAAPLVFLRACWQIGKARREDAQLREWYHEREVYRRERGR